MSLFDLSGQVAVITGSSRGIGRAIAERMAEHGAQVVISSRKAEPLLVDRLHLERTKILRLGGIVPDLFLCQTRKQTHCYRIPAVVPGEGCPTRRT